jgi:hypothetical protein
LGPAGPFGSQLGHLGDGEAGGVGTSGDGGRQVAGAVLRLAEPVLGVLHVVVLVEDGNDRRVAPVVDQRAEPLPPVL